MTFRGILLGTAAFGAVFLLDRQLGSVFKDIRRYDKLRAMSGDSSLLSEGIKQAGGYAMRAVRKNDGATSETLSTNDDGESRQLQKSESGSFLDTLLKDMMRYAAIRAM